MTTAAEVAGLGDDELTGPLGPQGRYRRRGLEILLRRLGLGPLPVVGAWLVVGEHRIHLASGAVRGPDGAVRPRDGALAPVADIEDPGLGRILAEALRLTREGGMTSGAEGL